MSFKEFEKSIKDDCSSRTNFFRWRRLDFCAQFLINITIACGVLTLVAIAFGADPLSKTLPQPLPPVQPQTIPESPLRETPKPLPPISREPLVTALPKTSTSEKPTLAPPTESISDDCPPASSPLNRYQHIGKRDSTPKKPSEITLNSTCRPINSVSPEILRLAKAIMQVDGISSEGTREDQRPATIDTPIYSIPPVLFDTPAVRIPAEPSDEIENQTFDESQLEVDEVRSQAVPTEEITVENVPMNESDLDEPDADNVSEETSYDGANFQSSFAAEGDEVLNELTHSLPTNESPQSVGLVDPYWVVDGTIPIRSAPDPTIPDSTAPSDLESLVWASLAHSPYIRSILLTPQIRETEVAQAYGNFDPSRFAESIWTDRSDPVGNTLITGGPPSLDETLLNNKVGVRRRNEMGGSFEAAQELGLRDNNSLFFLPRRQADMRMVMRYTQPLMRGAGRTYNRSTITVAELSTSVARNETTQSLQNHVYQLSEAYWNLFYHRSNLLQLQRGIQNLNRIRNELENRRDLDLIDNQLYRAHAAVSSLEARLARTYASLVADEESIKRSVNAPWMNASSNQELIPTSMPLQIPVPVVLEKELEVALLNRPDVLAIRDELQAAHVRLQVAENELKPTLNMVTDFYIRGLNGEYDVARSFGDQFGAGRPSYSGGLEYLRPRNQTTARAIRRSRHLEIQQILFRLEDRLLDVSREVRTAFAAVEASYAELKASVDSTIATQYEVNHLEGRWSSNLFLDPNQIALGLEQLIDAHQRLIQAENSWALAQAQYMTALARLKLATGTLLSLEQIPPEPVE